ncbi:MAG: uracil-DNA glycosylase family protein [Pseudomonadota bacterium]
MTTLEALTSRISSCTLCADRFAATQTAHAPRPVVYPSTTARILIAGQAPGARVHASGVPFDDPSGDRLRDWLGVDRETFYDRTRIAIVPMAFCFPGYDAKGSDLPPPKLCAETWRAVLLAEMPQTDLTLLVGQYAQGWHMGKARKKTLTETVRAWRSYGPDILPLPHPSWRNTAWLKRNPWFEAEILPWLRQRVRDLIA